MAPNVERIIQCIKKRDQDSVQVQLDYYNNEYAECFFYNVEERERRKQRELEEFRKNKFRDYVPDSDSDFNSDSEGEDPDIRLRQRLAEALVCFIRSQLQPGVLQVCLRTLRILSRDRQALGPLVTENALLTLAHMGGISSLPSPLHHEKEEEEVEEDEDDDDDGLDSQLLKSGVSTCECAAMANAKPLAISVVEAKAGGATETLAQAPAQTCTSTPTTRIQDSGASCTISATAGNRHGNPATAETSGDCRCCRSRREGGHGVMARGKRDAREERGEEGEEEKEEDREVWRKEAMKALCNVIYNSQRAQERASTLRLLSGLTERLKVGIESRAPSSGQFYELRLLFLLTALRPELRHQLQQEHGVSMLTTALEQCLAVRWGEGHEVLNDRGSSPVPREVAQRAMEILKTLFNITYSLHRQEPDEEDAALYRHLAAVLHHCLLLYCDGEERTEELQGHAVNVLSALPLRCLDVLLSVRLAEGSQESGGVNMDCVQTLLFFMEKRLDRGQRLKERLIPVLNLLTESCRAHRETRRYLRQQILPPLRDVALRPEQGVTLRNRLVRLMTHVDTDLKHCAAELLFVLCKENVSRFVKYTGYGNAAGLLVARGLLGGRGTVSHTRYSSDSDSDTEEYRQAKAKINLVTGRVEEEQLDPMEGMTEEEKELEAHRLISMFNRLSREKIIQPLGVTTDGRLAPMCGQMRGCTLQEEEEEDDEEEEEEEEEEEGGREEEMDQ